MKSYSDYLTKPVVEKARAERGIIDDGSTPQPPDFTKDETVSSSGSSDEAQTDKQDTAEDTTSADDKQSDGDTPSEAQEPVKDNESDNTSTQTDEIGIIIDGEELVLDVAPQIVGDRVLVPLRAIFERLGAEVNWDEENGLVSIIKDGTTIEFLVDDTSVMVNQNQYKMDDPAQIVNERTLVPMRFLAIELGYNVDWDPQSREVIVNE